MRMRRKPLAEINVVPYIDVMLVLLVIFMITAPLLSQGVSVELPKATAKPLSEQKEPIVVSVNATGEYFLNIHANPEQPISAPVLQAEVMSELQSTQKEGNARPILIKGDKRVGYDKVVGAMVLLQAAGAESVGLVTDDPSPVNTAIPVNPVIPAKAGIHP